MKYKYSNFVERRELEIVIKDSIPVLEKYGIDANEFYGFLIENPEAVSNPEQLLMEMPWNKPVGKNNPNWWARNAPSWLGGNQAAADTWNRNNELGNQKDSMQKALKAYGGATIDDGQGNQVPNPNLPDWLKTFAQNPNTYDSQAVNYSQEKAKQNVQKYHGDKFPASPATPPAPTPPAPQQPTPPPTPPTPPTPPQPQPNSPPAGFNSQKISQVAQKLLADKSVIKSAPMPVKKFLQDLITILSQQQPTP